MRHRRKKKSQLRGVGRGVEAGRRRKGARPSLTSICQVGSGPESTSLLHTVASVGTLKLEQTPLLKFILQFAKVIEF